ncbi:MAG: recombination protein RecR [Cyclobacteriaceae bacterium]|nr:recombination protein RecR [Cyclobacteriaceae bacterium]
MDYPSKLIEEAVTEISRLPGIGRKTAFRLALHLLKQDPEFTHRLAGSLLNLRDNIKRCSTCHMLSDTEECTCMHFRKDPTTVCVVEDTPDVMAIQNTAQYNGYFHVLGGVISPLEGIGPGELNIETLISRIASPESQVKEVILALSATMEGDTTSFYIARKLKAYNVKITTLARGVPVGGELEYTDEITLGRSIVKRMTYETGE